jgi:type II secretory pathway pseudopilin PulG
MKRKAIKKAISFFNMIEVALAMAIIAFGMTSILGLFPVGLNASRMSQAENYSADIVEQIFGYLKNYAEASDTNYQNALYATTAFPTAINRTALIGVPSKILDNHSSSFLSAYMASDTTVYSEFFPNSGIYRVPMAGGLMPCVFFIVQGPSNTKNIDFSAMVLVWRSPVSSVVATGDATNDANWITWPPNASFDYEYLAGLNIEISWPLEKKYAEREKRFYYFVVSRPQ